MKTLVSGATGFLGSLLCKALVEKGYIVYGLTKNGANNRITSILKAPNFELITVDLLKDRIDLPEVDVVFHMASQQPSNASLTFRDYMEGNVSLTERLLSMLSNPSMIVYSSTQAVLSSAKNIMDETMPVVLPLHDYCLSKYFAEKVIENKSIKKQIKLAILRYPSVYGKDQEGGLIHYFYQQAINNEPINVFSMGKPLRNVVHADDVIQSNILCLENADKIKNDIFMIGSENSLSMENIARVMIQKTQSQSNINLVEKETFNNDDVVIDVSKAKKNLGYHPKKIEEGIGQYVGEMQ
jgi:nucleoside-diphosphate-sugar epimerase